jgi:hypothetical protein
MFDNDRDYKTSITISRSPESPQNYPKTARTG